MIDAFGGRQTAGTAMLVSDLLQAKGVRAKFVATVQPVASVAHLVDQLAEHNVGALVVSTDGVAVSGIVSERDIVRGMRAHGTRVLDLTAADIMTSHVIMRTPADHIDSVMRLMTSHRIRHLPIVAHGQLVGIVSIGDVVKARIDQFESDRVHFLQYISAG